MDQLKNSPCGDVVPIGRGLSAFLPNPIPRELNLSRSLVFKLDEASRSVAMLAGVGETIPNPRLLIRPFMRREAVLSSRIEGTQASLSDLFMYEASGVRRLDVIEVANYIRALEKGIELLENLPICLRLINELHGILLEGVRGHERSPGALRREQNWIGSEGTEIGEARFVPPPPNMVRDLMHDLELFINEPIDMPPLVQCALAHYQIEAIHPYLDGNGRIGRLLITLFLYAKQVLPTPLLYLSAYFENNRSQYYDQLFNLSATGDWETWLMYFLRGVKDQADDALLRVRKIRALQEEYRAKLQSAHASANALKLTQELFASPFVTAPSASKWLGVTNAGARRILARLVDLGIVEEMHKSWPRLFVATEVLDAVQVNRSPD